MDKKLTDNEIVKALECCIKSSHFGECFENKCPLVSEKGCKVGKEILYPYALDLINCLEARIGVYETCNARKDEAIKHLESEVKRLQAENERLKDCIDEQDIEIASLWKRIEDAKAEAYKRCIENAKEELYEWVGADNCIPYSRIKRVLDNLLKELVGEDNESEN